MSELTSKLKETKKQRKIKLSYSAQSHSVIYARVKLEILENVYVEKHKFRFVLQDWNQVRTGFGIVGLETNVLVVRR